MAKHFFWIIAIVLLILRFNSIGMAGQFDASTIPKGTLLLKHHTTGFFTSASFNDDGKAVNFTDPSAITYIETPIEAYYGLTDTLMVGVILPLGYTRREAAVSSLEETASTFRLKDFWVMAQHQFLVEPFVAASSIRVKLPTTDPEPLEAGLNIDDGQFDLYPVYYIDWEVGKGLWINGQIGYRYRIRRKEADGTTLKPSDELRLMLETGYEFVRGFKLFTFSDFTKFFSRKLNDENQPGTSGHLYIIGVGINAWLHQTLRWNLSLGADWFGKNQFRGVRGQSGLSYAFKL